jgi:putative flippase GtrA
LCLFTLKALRLVDSKGRIPSRPARAIRQKLIDLDERYGVFKLAKFAIASAIGFLLAEGILTLSVLRLYGKLSAPSDAYASPTFLAIDVAALALGVAASFFLNEQYTVHVQRTPNDGASNSLPFRLLKFEGVNAMGNVTILGVQLALLVTLSVTPVIGNIVGALVSYPVTYLVSMHFVWRRTSGGSKGNDETSSGVGGTASTFSIATGYLAMRGRKPAS